MLLENISLQDRDLLGRLSQYFASIEARLREGQGWVIFNANRQRAARITQFVSDRLAEYRPFISYYLVPWRDFALNAYMLKVELPTHAPQPVGGTQEPPTPEQREYQIAGRVSHDMFFQMRFCDLLILSDVRPAHPHEVEHLVTVLTERYRQRRAVFLLTPRMPHELAADFIRLQGSPEAWQTLFEQLYQTNLIAL
jgi:hypothetical protein